MRLSATRPSIPWRSPRPVTARVDTMQVSAGQPIVECLVAQIGLHTTAARAP